MNGRELLALTRYVAGKGSDNDDVKHIYILLGGKVISAVQPHLGHVPHHSQRPLDIYWGEAQLMEKGLWYNLFCQL